MCIGRFSCEIVMLMHGYEQDKNKTQLAELNVDWTEGDI